MHKHTRARALGVLLAFFPDDLLTASFLSVHGDKQNMNILSLSSLTNVRSKPVHYYAMVKLYDKKPSSMLPSEAKAETTCHATRVSAYALVKKNMDVLKEAKIPFSSLLRSYQCTRSYTPPLPYTAFLTN